VEVVVVVDSDAAMPLSKRDVSLSFAG